MKIKLNITRNPSSIMIPANAQNEFKSLLIQTVGVRKINGGMHGKLKMALYILIQQQKKTIKEI
jgi:hypothetical protein